MDSLPHSLLQPLNITYYTKYSPKQDEEVGICRY